MSDTRRETYAALDRHFAKYQVPASLLLDVFYELVERGIGDVADDDELHARHHAIYDWAGEHNCVVRI